MRSTILPSSQRARSFIEASRRAQITDCAVEAIADLGFAKASLAQIARRAGISTGVILYHFASKEDLIREVVAHVFAAGEAFITPRIDQSSARAALATFIEAGVAFIAANPKNVLAVMNISRGGHGEGDLAWLDPAIRQPRQAGLQAILGAGQANGEFRPFSMRVMVASIIEALDAIPPELAADPALDLGAYARELSELFDRATAAAMCPPPRSPTPRSPTQGASGS